MSSADEQVKAHDPLFAFHKLNEVGQNKAQDIATCFTGFLRALELNNCLIGREGAIVKTKLEEACFFAKKSMANQTVNQEAKSITTEQVNKL